MTKLTHRHGGEILSVDAIAHETHQGVATWEFIGRVKWDDGSESEAAHIAPNCLCGEPADVNPYFERMNAYLASNGEWLDKPKRVRGGYLVHWVPKKPNGRAALAEAEAS